MTGYVPVMLNRLARRTGVGREPEEFRRTALSGRWQLCRGPIHTGTRASGSRRPARLAHQRFQRAQASLSVQAESGNCRHAPRRLLYSQHLRWP
jgi:hypothetical protein